MKNTVLYRVCSFFLAVLMLVSLLPPVQVWAADPVTVYLDPASGSDSNTGLSQDTPVQTLEAAYSQLAAEGGTLVLLSDVTYTANKVFPTCSYPVTITSATGAEGFVSSGNLQMSGDTTFENITFTLTKASSTVYLSAEGKNLTIGEGVTCVPCGDYYFCMTAGGRYSAKTGDVTLTVKSGTWRSLYGVHGYNLTGNLTMNLLGGTFRNVATGYNGQISGDVTVNISNFTATNGFNYCNTHANGLVGGNVVVNLGDNAKLSSINKSTGTTTGTTTINVVGDCSGSGSFTGNGTNTSLVLQHGKIASAVSGFGSVSVDVPAERTLTLATGIAANTVKCAGTLNFEGTGSLTATAVTGTVNCTITGDVLTNKAFVTAPADADIVFPAEYGVVAENGKWMVLDKENFKGLVVKAESDVTMTFYKDHTRETEDKIQPDYKETIDGYTYYYFAGISGYYCYDASRAGDYTIYQRLYITAAERDAGYVEEVVMEARGDGWDYKYYYGQVDEYIEVSENDMTEKWHTEVPLVTPVFTNEDKAAHQMTTQPELEAFIQGLDGADDNMYIFSIGKSAKYSFDIPIVFFTKTDLSGCTTLEEVAAALEKDGLPNVGYKAQMHGDEHAAGEGALNVIYQMDQAENQYLLENMNIYIMPRINPDGAYECQRNLRSASMLYSGVASSTDPNRHMLSLASVESRLYLRTVQLFDPVAELDGHERQRSSNIGDNQISGSWRYGDSQEMFDLQYNMVMSMFDALDAVDLSGAWYSDNINTTPGANTRSFANIQGRIHILMETRGIYLGNECYDSRTASHIVVAMQYFKFCAENVDDLVALACEDTQEQVIRGKTYEETDTIILASSQVAHPEYTLTTEKSNFANGTVAAYEQVPYIYEPTHTRAAPTAYVIPADLPKIDEILELMDLQQITYYALPANTAISLQQYIGPVSAVTLTAEQTVTFPNGAYVFQMDQVNGYVLAVLMEPDHSATDLVEQGRISMGEGGAFPIYRYIRNLTEEEVGITYTVATAAPTGLSAADASAAANDGVISGLDAEKLYEYKVAGADVYTQLPAGTTTIEGLTPGTYYVRFQADENGVTSMDAECVVGCTVTVYVSAASGSDTNAGTSEDAAVATLEGAYAKLSEIIGTAGDTAEGTIVLLDNYTISSAARVDLPAHTFPVTIVGKTSAVKLIFTPQSTSEANQALAFNGPTTLDKLTFQVTVTGSYSYIYGCGNAFVIGADILTTGTNNTILVAGDRTAGAADTDMTIKGGTWCTVYAANFRAGHSGTAKLTITGGEIKKTVRTVYNQSCSGDVMISLKNMSVGDDVVLGSYTSGSISGDVTLILGENVSIGGSVYTGCRSSGNMTGVVTVVADGADLSELNLVNAPGASNTSGTVAKGVLSYASGTAVAVEGFDETHIHTSAGGKVTLGADLTVNKVIGGGFLELAGHTLTAADITVEGDIFVSDSATGDYDVSDEIYGNLVGIEGAKAADGYVKLTTTEGTSFHNAKLDMKSVVLRPNAAGIYYIGSFTYDDVLAENVSQFGMAVSLYDTEPMVDDADENSSLYTTGAASALIANIFSDEKNTEENAAAADMKVYARAYVIADGEIYYGDTVAFSLKQLVRNADKNLWSDLTDTQKQGLLQLYADYADVMKTWNLTNIK